MNTNGKAAIYLPLQSADDILNRTRSLTFSKRRLNENAEEFIVEEASALKQGTAIKLLIEVPVYETDRAYQITKAIRQHFAWCRSKAEKQLKRTLTLGWRSLLSGFIFLVLMYATGTLVVRLVPAGALVITLREFLIILGWVALWRPAELLLYEWMPYRRQAKLFGRLERCYVQVVAENMAVV